MERGTELSMSLSLAPARERQSWTHSGIRREWRVISISAHNGASPTTMVRSAEHMDATRARLRASVTAYEMMRRRSSSGSVPMYDSSNEHLGSGSDVCGSNSAMGAARGSGRLYELRADVERADCRKPSSEPHSEMLPRTDVASAGLRCVCGFADDLDERDLKGQCIE
jgi:hypothetical protein